MDGLALARVVHVLAVVIWVGGVSAERCSVWATLVAAPGLAE